jgi:hypothetical protein
MLAKTPCFTGISFLSNFDLALTSFRLIELVGGRVGGIAEPGDIGGVIGLM